MKFCFAYDSAYPWFNGGVEKRRFLIMEELCKAGHEVHHFTMYREGMPSEEFVYKGVHYHCVGRAVPASAMYKNGRRNIIWPLSYATKLSTKLWKYRFDLIDADAFPFLHIPAIAFYAKMTRAKLVITWLEVWGKEYWSSYLGKMGKAGYAMEKLTAHSSKISIAISELTKERMVSRFKIASKSVIVFPAAISKADVLKFQKKHKAKKSGTFIAIGRLVPQKKMDIAIHAISKTTATLKIVGRGPEKERLVALAKQLGVEKRVKFIEMLKTDEDVMRELQDAQALLMFSEREGLSIISIEALVLGTPVIITEKTELTKEIRRHCHTLKAKSVGEELNLLIKNKKSVLYNPKIKQKDVLEEFSVERANGIYKQIAKELEN